MNNNPSYTSKQPLVLLDGVGLRSESRWLVENISLQIRPGEILTLIGPNGAGKSTTAKLVLGVLQPTTGSRYCVPQLRIGYMPQKMQPDSVIPLSVKRLMQLTNRLDSSQLEHALDATGVAHLQNAAVSTLSGGELQRVMLARAIARKPDLLILDEPTQGMDVNGELALYALIASIRSSLECGVLLISHNLHMVMAATDHVVCINSHICCEGPPGSVVTHNQYQKLFGTQKDGIALYQHHHNHIHLPDGKVTAIGNQQSR